MQMSLLFAPLLPWLASQLVTVLPDEHQQPAADAIVEVIPTIIGTAGLILVCEVACYRTVLALWEQPGGKALHLWAIGTTLWNMFVLGTGVFVAARLYVI